MNFSLRVVSLVSMALFFTAACGSTSDESKKVGAKKEVAQIVKVDTETSQAKSDKPDEAKTLKVDETTFVKGKHYVEISPEMQTDAAPGKVEVVELMWLGCPHCYTLEPTMLKYKKNHPDFVEFKQVPAMLNPSWAADARTYYLAEILDPTGEKEIISHIFEAIHEQRRRLRKPASVVRFFEQLGYTKEQIENVQNSMAFQAKLKRAEEIGKASQSQSVPTVIINGKYRTSVYMTGSEENLMKVIDMLTKKEKG